MTVRGAILHLPHGELVEPRTVHIATFVELPVVIRFPSIQRRIWRARLGGHSLYSAVLGWIILYGADETGR